ncbi:metal-sensitive transcriptional regulator [Longirhabdus pacifica]|uniref:metal-sensitive transcriptional regulator n=1 Tax=Longirhabdus pacifica TaxID=2305227 RepID=UPI0010089043|nr:metal-sensitive transcriptional regulator [Longirhabdus pacifica]
MDYNMQMKNRLKRIEGQIRGVLNMMETEQDCKEVVSQMLAARNAIDRNIGVIVSKNLEDCLRLQIEKGEQTDDILKEAVDLFVKSR